MQGLRFLALAVVVMVAMLPAGPAAAGTPAQAPSSAGPFTSCTAQSQAPQAECEALVALYNAAGGPAWTTRTNWLQTDAPCGWYGVTCSAGHVTELNLSGNNLSGSIPPQLANISTLSHLSLQRNQLTGGIPSELGNLSSLHYLYLYTNPLGGGIPPELGNLSNLLVLHLNGTQLSGSIPPQLGNLSNLQRFEAFGNQLSGALPGELGNLSNLESLNLGANAFTGTLPIQWANMTGLMELYLNRNRLSGSIPPQLGALSSLRSLYLNANQFDGSIPSQLGSLASLQELDLHSNQLAGAVPPSLANLGALRADRTDLGYNMLIAADPTLIAFLNAKDPDWANTQTVPPAGVAAATVSATGAQLSWTPILYTDNGGYYEISYAATAGGPYAVHGATANKLVGGYLAGGLPSGPSYYFVVRTFTPAHGDQRSALWSGYSNPAFLPSAYQRRAVLPLVRRP